MADRHMDRSSGCRAGPNGTGLLVDLSEQAQDLVEQHHDQWPGDEELAVQYALVQKLAPAEPVIAGSSDTGNLEILEEGHQNTLVEMNENANDQADNDSPDDEDSDDFDIGFDSDNDYYSDNGCCDYTECHSILNTRESMPSICPATCGCTYNDAAAHTIPPWQRRCSESEGEDDFLAPDNRHLLFPPFIPRDSELEIRTDYVYNTIAADCGLTPSEQPQEIYFKFDIMQYRPLSTPELSRIDPPEPSWLTDLYSEIIADPDAVQHLIINAMQLIQITLEFRTIIYEFMVHENPKTYIAKRINQLRAMRAPYFRAFRYLWDNRPRHCNRLESALLRLNQAVSTVYHILVTGGYSVEQRIGEDTPVWLWHRAEACIDLWYHKFHMQESVISQCLQEVEWAEREPVDSRAVWLAATVYEFSLLQVRTIDCFFSYLRMEPKVLREALYDVDPGEEHTLGIMAHLPTLYDSVVEYV